MRKTAPEKKRASRNFPEKQCPKPMDRYVFTAPTDCWRAGSLRVSGSPRVSLLSLFSSKCFHCEWEPFVTPFNLFLPLLLCKVPAPDVRYYLQPELDQPRQMLRPAGHSESRHRAVFSATATQSSCYLFAADSIRLRWLFKTFKASQLN